MKTLVVPVLMALVVPAAGAKVWTTVYRCDEATPLEALDPNHPTVYREIMVGTRLAIVISSDAKGPWSGALASSWDDWLYGELAGRDFNPKTRSYDGSCLPAAGGTSFTRITQDSRKVGLQFSAPLSGVPGDWFIMDYHAKQVGVCTLRFYSPPANFDLSVETFSFAHVPSRDLNGDAIVDFKDFVLLASHWHETVTLDPNGPPIAFDLDGDGRIGLGDLALFSEYWLERTDCRPVVTEPSSPLTGNR